MFLKFTLPGILLLLTLGFGLWVSLSGRPYNGILFNIHKLAALAVVVFLVFQFVLVLENVYPQQQIIALIALAGLCIIALFVTGALMSIGIPQYTLVLSIHRVALILLPIALTVLVYFLAQGAKV